MKLKLLIVLVIFGLLMSGFFIARVNEKKTVNAYFNAERAWRDLQTQVEFGPRTPGSHAHQMAISYISEQLLHAGWDVEIQQTEGMGHTIKNIIAKKGKGSPWILLGAHYDTRFIADHDPDASKQVQPVPGANDGASGVAVLLEMARAIQRPTRGQIWLVFFDAEDQGRIEGWDWIMGSRAFVNDLKEKPDAVVVIDMIGDKDLNIFREKSSDPALTESIWQVAASSGFSEYFINEDKYSILDDHFPFLEAGIPAINIIDFDYESWHTSQDDLQNVSEKSLQIVGQTLLNWLEEYEGFYK